MARPCRARPRRLRIRGIQTAPPRPPRRCEGRAGRAAGENNGSGTRRREQYAGQRRNGLLAAYAYMAGVADNWNRAEVTVEGKRIERDNLVEKPQVALVFLNLPDGKDTLPRRT